MKTKLCIILSMVLCFIGCSDDDEPEEKKSVYEVTINQSGDFQGYFRSLEVDPGDMNVLKNKETDHLYFGKTILEQEEMDSETITLRAIATDLRVFIDMYTTKDDNNHKPMQWDVIVRKDGKEVGKETLVFENDGKTGAAQWIFHY